MRDPFMPPTPISVWFPSWVQTAGKSSSPLMTSRLSWCTAEQQDQGRTVGAKAGRGGGGGETGHLGGRKMREAWSGHSLSTLRKIQMCLLEELGPCPGAFLVHSSPVTHYLWFHMWPLDGPSSLVSVVCPRNSLKVLPLVENTIPHPPSRLTLESLQSP